MRPQPGRGAGPRPAPRPVPQWRPARPVAAVAAFLLTVAVALACADGQTPPSNTLEFALVAGKTAANGSFNFNGYAKGALTVTVPVGWKVVIRYSNAGALRHSLDVIPYAGTQPDSAPPPAFAGASTKDLVDGIGVGKQETVTFTAAKAGNYEFLCGVLGHAQAGMWDRLIVSTAVKTPSVRPGGGVTLKIQ